MLKFRNRFLIYLTAISAGALLISNLAAVKLWNLFGIAVDGGVIVFPLTYIIGDLTVEFYGKKIAKNVVLAGLLVNIIAVLVFTIVIALASLQRLGHAERIFDGAGLCAEGHRRFAGRLCLCQPVQQLHLHQDEKQPWLLFPKLHRPGARLIGLRAYARLCHLRDRRVPRRAFLP